MINYRASTKKLRAAYFKWKKKRHCEKHHVVSFVAGYNAAMNEKKEEKNERN